MNGLYANRTIERTPELGEHVDRIVLAECAKRGVWAVNVLNGRRTWRCSLARRAIVAALRATVQYQTGTGSILHRKYRVATETAGGWRPISWPDIACLLGVDHSGLIAMQRSAKNGK